ncbi:hypothetical protein PAHAL_9G129200 [Panicum hallii]|uniref:Uncharacterized protein n=1 Tax=Panicum hallii TaxID=206008 RepID=A0A2S3IJ02_9POAL|nr:hypothetical protein PAHAL_9G129200 [Panicum hallii]
MQLNQDTVAFVHLWTFDCHVILWILYAILSSTLLECVPRLKFENRWHMAVLRKQSLVTVIWRSSSAVQ